MANNYIMSSLLHQPSRSSKHVVPTPPEQFDHPPFQHPHNILLQRKQIEDVVRQKQEVLQHQRLMEYEQQLRLKQRAKGANSHRGLGGDSMHQPIYKYCQQLQCKMNREDKSIKQNEHAAQYTLNPVSAQSQRQNNYQTSRQAYTLRSNYERAVIGDRQQRTSRQMQFESEIESQRVIQQYQQELLDKINPKDKKNRNHKANNLHTSISAKYQLDDVAGGENIIVNKRSIEDKYQQHNRNHKETIQHNHLTSHRQKIQNKLAFQTIMVNQTIKKNAQTINISQIQQPFLQSKYQTVNCKKSKQKDLKKRANKKPSIHSERRTQSITTQMHHRSLISHSKNEPNEPNPLRKIQNRLRVSMLIFKDSQLKNKRHEANHLQNTYETQVRLRKDIKDRINNHPKVLEKHRLVVTSR